MNTKEKTYVTASELAETLDISMGKAYSYPRFETFSCIIACRNGLFSIGNCESFGS